MKIKNNPLPLLMNPKSIAVVGAGNNFLKMGTMQALSILKDGYKGKFFPVHPREKEVLGHKAYPSVLDIPETPDLALLIVPSEQSIGLLEDFGKKGTKRVIVITAGFKEVGIKGAELEKQLREIADKYGLRFLGPNCMGILNSQSELNLTVLPYEMAPGSLGMASQSGTYVTQTFAYLRKKGIRFSKAISVGNETDIDIVDALEYLGEDEQTKAIALYIEGLKDGHKFLRVAQKITPHKPIVVQYAGGSTAGARAGKSHTGAIAGPDFLYEGILKQAGVLRVHSIEDLYSHGWVLATQPPLRGNRLGIVTNSGGPGTSMADIGHTGGMEVPTFSAELQEKIRAHIPAHASSGNPVDLTFHMDIKGLSTTIPEMIMESGETDALIIHGAMSTGFMREKYPHIRELLGNIPLEDILGQGNNGLKEAVSWQSKYNVPLLISSFFNREDNYTAAYQDNNVPVFDAPEKAARGLLALLEYKKIRERKGITAPSLPEKSQETGRIIEKAVKEGQKSLDEYQSKKVLAAYDIPVSEDRLVFTLAEAEAAAAEIGFPVALKACSTEVMHKTEKGLVFLSQNNMDDVRRSFSKIRESAGEEMPVLVTKMLPGKREFIAGMTRYPGFGPCVLFGLGGIFAEALKDVTFRAAPLSETEATEMLFDIKAKKLLGEFRGLLEVNIKALANILQKISFISLLHPEIAEIDLNPVIIYGSEPVVADALVVFKR